MTTRSGDTIYVCQYNPLIISSDGISLSDISLSTNNGEITVSEWNEQKFYAFPKKYANATIYVSKIKGSDTTLTDSVIFNVKRVPHFGISIAGVKSDSIRKRLICYATGFFVRAHPNGCFNHKVHGYKLKVLRNSSEIFSEEVSGPRFSPTIKDFFKTLQNDDIVRLYDIRYHDCDTSVISTIPQAAFRITNAENYGILRPGVAYAPEDTTRDPKTGILYEKYYAEDALTGELFIDSSEVRINK